MPKTETEFRRWLRMQRVERNVRKIDAGRIVGVSWRTFSLWERGKMVPGWDNLLRLAQWGGVTVDELVRMLRARVPIIGASARKVPKPSAARTRPRQRPRRAA